MSTQPVLHPSQEHAAPTPEFELQPTRQETEAASEGRTINQETGLTRKSLLKVVAASGSFFFAGNNDGSLGALTPYILRTYDLGTEYIALMWVLVKTMSCP
jgi:hypothetical protein